MRKIFGWVAMLSLLTQSFLPSLTAVYADEEAPVVADAPAPVATDTPAPEVTNAETATPSTEKVEKADSDHGTAEGGSAQDGVAHEEKPASDTAISATNPKNDEENTSESHDVVAPKANEVATPKTENTVLRDNNPQATPPVEKTETVVEKAVDKVENAVASVVDGVANLFRSAQPTDRSATPQPTEAAPDNTTAPVEKDAAPQPAIDREALMKKSPALVAKELGINWDKDRAFYAKKAGIDDYTGTSEQNEALKVWLIDNATNLPVPTSDATEKESKKGKTTVDVREATPDGSAPRTEFWVGEQINTNAVIDNSGLGETLYAKAKLTLPKKYIRGEPVFVQEKNMRDYQVTSDDTNRYVNFNITVEDGKKVALPIYFTVQNNSTVPQGFKTPITFSLRKEGTDELLDEKTTVYTARVLKTKLSLDLRDWSGRYVWGLADAHGTGDKDDQGYRRRTALMRFVNYAGFSQVNPDLDRYTGWVEYMIRQGTDGTAPNGWGKSFPENNRFIVQLPSGTRPAGTPNKDTWKYCYSWWHAHCWTYHADNNTMELEGKFRNNEWVRFVVEHFNQPYYDDAQKTNVHYNKISVSVSANPGTEYEHNYDEMKYSIGWTPKIETITPISELRFNKGGNAQWIYQGIPYTTNHQEYDQKNTLFYDVSLYTWHQIDDYKKTYTLYGFTDHDLDNKLYYRSLRRNNGNRSSDSGGKRINETPHKIYGILSDNSEVLLKENLKHGELLELNDVNATYKAIKVVFDTPITSKDISFNMRFHVGVKDSAWAEIENNLLNVEEKKVSGWGDFVNKWDHTTEYDDYKFFNSATFDYSDSNSTDHQTADRKGYMFFKKDYITSSADKWNGDHIVPYNLDPLAMQREIFSRMSITKNQHDGSPWTDYAKNQLWINGLKYLALLPEGIDYVSWSVAELSTKVDGVALAEPKIIPNYKETGKTGLIFELWDIKVEKDWYVHRRHFRFKVQVTNKANEGNNFVEGYFYWDTAPGWIPGTWANYKDKLDLDGDGDVEEKFHQIWSTRITYTQWRDIVLKNTLSQASTGNFASSAVLDTIENKPYYKLNLYNNYIEDMKGLSLIATLPRVDDLAIVPDQDGNYSPRGSDLSLSLSGSLEADPANAGLLDKWSFLYSTDLTSTIEATRNATWLPADQINDFSKVTMIKMVQKADTLVRQKDVIDFFFPIKMPKNLPDQQKFFTASASAAFSTNDKTYIESNKITFSFVPHYRVQGKVFADVDDNGSYAGDEPLKDYTLALHHENGDPVVDEAGQPMTTITDQDWWFLFKVMKRGRYYISMLKKYANDKVAKLFQVDDVRVVWAWGNDAEVDPTDPTGMRLRSSIFNLDPYSVSDTTNIYSQPSSLLAVRNFWLVPQNGKITIKLTDFDDHSENIEGAKYQLRNNQWGVFTLTTNKNGEVTTEVIPFGTYTLEQISSDARHMISTALETINLTTMTHPLSLTNKVKRSTLTLELTDVVDNTLKLSKGKYELRNAKNELVTTLTTDKVGAAKFDELPYGTYTLKQIEAPQYYHISTEPVEIVVNADLVHKDLTNIRKSGTITLTLRDARDPKNVLEGGKYTLIDPNGKEIQTWLTTNEKGQISVSNLPYGDYTLVQTEAPSRYRLDASKIKVALYADQKDPRHENKKRSRREDEPIIQPKPEPQKPEIEIIPEPTPESKEEVPVVPAPMQPVAPDPIVYREVLKKTEVVQPTQQSSDVHPQTNSADTLIKTYVKRLPKTWAFDESQLHAKVGVVSVKGRKTVETSLPDAKTFRLAGSKNTDLAYWLSVLPASARKADQYIVLPTQGLVMPVNTVSSGSKAYNNFVNGRNEDFLSYLHNGAVQLPATSKGSYGELGNKVIAGHSSYRKSSNAKYKTHFQKIIGMESGEQVWIYKKDASGKYVRYVYRVNASYNTSATDISVLHPTATDQLTLMTCTPIGWVAGRRMVKATFIGH